MSCHALFIIDSFMFFFFFLMVRRRPRSTPLYSSAASDVYKRQRNWRSEWLHDTTIGHGDVTTLILSLIHISEPTRHLRISYAVFCLKKKTNYEPKIS